MSRVENRVLSIAVCADARKKPLRICFCDLGLMDDYEYGVILKTIGECSETAPWRAGVLLFRLNKRTDG